MAYRSYIDEDELERRRRADALASFAPSSPDSWIEQQANRNPTWMRRQPDMAFSLDEAENAPDMSFGLDEAERRPDMSFTEEETATAPDPSFRPDMAFSLEETEQFPRTTHSPLAAASVDSSQLQPRLSALLQGRGVPQGPQYPEMDRRWREAEMNALDRSGYGGEQSYGIGEGLRDFAPMAIGGTLDILLNKGRGLGALTAGGMQALSQERVRRQAQERNAADYALAARQQRESGGDPELERAYKLAQMERWQSQAELGGENLEQRQLGNLMRQAKMAYDQDPNNPQALALVAKVKEITGYDLTGLGNQAQGRAMQVVGRAQGADLAGPTADARNRSDLAFAAPTAAQKEIGQAQGALAAAPTQAAANEALGKVPERTQRDEAFATQFAKDNEAPIKIGLALNAIIAKSEFGEPAPGLDPATRLGARIPGATQAFPKLFPQDAQIVLQNLDLAEEAYSRDQSGAAIGVKEAAKFLRQVIGSPLASAQDVQAAINRFNERNNEYLRGRAAANPEAAGKVLSASGLNISGPAPRPAAGPAQSGGGGARMPAQPAPTRASAPRAIRQADGSFTVEGGPETYTEDEIQRLIRKGAVRP